MIKCISKKKQIRKNELVEQIYDATSKKCKKYIQIILDR